MLEDIKRAMQDSKVVKVYVYLNFIVPILLLLGLGIYELIKIPSIDLSKSLLGVMGINISNTQLFWIVLAALIILILILVFNFWFSSKIWGFDKLVIDGNISELKQWRIAIVIAIIFLPILGYFSQKNIIEIIFFEIFGIMQLILVSLRIEEVKAKL